VLSALSGVLLHDLRNPLHSATLLLEATELRPADRDALLVRLRAQLAKLDTLMSDVAGPLRELAAPTRVQKVKMGRIVADLNRLAADHDDAFASALAVDGNVELDVRVDPALLARAIFEAAAFMYDQMRRPPPVEGARVSVQIATDAQIVQISVGGLPRALPEEAAKTPFAIGGGGVRAALARALAQMTGATLRLDGGATAEPRFVFGVPRA
jgi:signal transduction histidine kinase